MCGITGFSSFNQNYLENKNSNLHYLEEMTETLIKRGPDSKGTYLDNHVALGHRRLSIRDIKDGAQPMMSKCGNYTIAYNGEIYNADDIKKDLQEKGYTFETTSDTEVILYAYAEYGLECGKLLNGIYAFAVSDKLNERLYLCRDRFGVKPLFYTVVDNTLIFGSEIKSLAKNPLVQLKLDDNSFNELFGLFPSRTEGNGLFKNIYEIKYASFGIFDKNGFREFKYWDLESKENTLTFKEAVEQNKYLVTDSITRQIVSDVPISSFLSGGLDSSIITGVVAEHFKKEGKRLDTYSFDYEENTKYFVSNKFQVDEDKLWAGKMVDIFNTNHEYLECDMNSLVDCLYKAVDSKDFPGMADIDSSLLYFCNKVSDKHKVALSGECADEIYGGYPWFHNGDGFNSNGFPWIRHIETRKDLLSPEFKSKLRLEEYVRNKYETSLSEMSVLPSENQEEKRRREISHLNIKWFMTTLLERMDRMSMYSGLEVRVPYADHRIVEFLWNMPWEYKYGNRVKNLLRTSFEDLLPYDLINRKKSPYPKTYNPKYEQMLGDILMNILNNKNSPIVPLLDKEKVSQFIKNPSDYGKPWFGQLMAAPQLLAFYIQINYFMEKYNLTV